MRENERRSEKREAWGAVGKSVMVDKIDLTSSPSNIIIS